MINNSCFIITSYVDTSRKEKISLKLLDYLKDKNLPIIFVGNHKIPESIQEKADWVLYTKENPKINRDMVLWSQIPYNPKFKTIYTFDSNLFYLSSLIFFTQNSRVFS